MGDPAIKRATWADLEALPANMTGELIAGVLYAMPRPRPKHGAATTRIASDVEGPYDRGRGGPGGWIIIVEPGIEVLALDVEEIVPDIAGWRRERLPEIPEHFTIAPDWVCEVLSPSTRRHDLQLKRPLYAKAGVEWMWIVDVDAQTLTASKNHDGQWLELGIWSGDDVARTAPFDAIEIRLADCWSR